MKIGELLYGFRVTGRQELPEIGAVLWRMTYEKNGADLIYLERADENKSFAIAFKTIPEDDTGVFHIIEHSVLCGSEKFPVKEPFVDLLKGSMQTFLNAMTYPDKTVYPVSSRNSKDFLNLIDVYMDAVLHPLILRDPRIFRQEGWHLELFSEEEDLDCVGVVLNEMKGAYSSVDEVISEEMMKAMFPDLCYGKDSGGEPSAITTLSYEKFLYFHQKYYHPSNARIFLDGSVNLDEVLPLLDGYLSAYEKKDIDAAIPDQPPVAPAPIRKYYPLSPSEDAEGKVRVALGFGTCRYDEQEKQIAVEVLLDLFTETNESPLKKALLSAGLCEDVAVSSCDGIRQSLVTLELRNTSEEKIPLLLDTLTRVFTEAAKGLDRRRLTAALNNLEFRLRERETGSFPIGLAFALSSLETWLYDGDPAQNLCYGETMAYLRREMDNGYFERVLREVFLENPHRATLIFLPSKTLEAEREKEEKARLATWKKSLGKEGVREIIRESEELRAWHETEDSEAARATLPTLTLSDISETQDIPTVDVGRVGDVPLLYHSTNTAGIAYLNLQFCVNDLGREELLLLPLLAATLGQLATEHYDALTLQDEIKTWLGNLYFTANAIGRKNRPDDARVNFTVSVSVLEDNRERVAEILEEILCHTNFSDTDAIARILRQVKLAGDESVIAAGHLFAIGRAVSHFTTSAAVEELLSGYEFYSFVKKETENLDKCKEKLSKSISSLAKKIITRERLTVGLTGKQETDFLLPLLSALKSDSVLPPEGITYPLSPVCGEGISVPSQVSYAVMAARDALPFDGTAMVAQKILSLDYLWNAIRVQGGAYGAGFNFRLGGTLFAYSYRDPNAARSLACYRKCADFLRKFAEGDPDLTKFIIGAVAAYEPLLSPRMRGTYAISNYWQGITREDILRTRREMIATTPKDLAGIADRIEKASKNAAICVVGSAAALDACGDLLTVRLDI